MKRRLAFVPLIVCLASFALLGQAGLYVPTGPTFETKTQDIVLHDSRRMKDLEMNVTYPAEKGTYPVIVWSHGAGGESRTYQPLAKWWAEHGYVVIRPTHDDAVRLRKAKGERVGLREVLSDAMFNPEGAANRAWDISFVLDSLGDIESRVLGSDVHLDEKRIGMGGHSYGAQTTMLISGATVQPGGATRPQSYADKRPIAFLAMSPEGRGQMGLQDESWDKCTRPAMYMTGSRDRGGLRQSAEWRKEPFTLSPGGDKYFVWIEGANHMSFVGLADREVDGTQRRRARAFMQSDEQKQIFDYVKNESLAYWDAYLKSNRAAKQYLLSDGLVGASGGKATVDRK